MFIFKENFIRNSKFETMKSSRIIYYALIPSILCIGFACSDKNKSKEVSEDDGKEANQELFTIVEELPGFKGGMEAFYMYMKNTLTYPSEARKSGVEGRVFVQFLIGPDGSLSDVESTEGIGAGCDNEVISVLKTAKGFTPGKQRGKAVRVRMGMPVTFKLDKEKMNSDNSPQGMIIVGETRLIPETLRVDAAFSDGKWSGTVYDKDNKVLPGANIVLAGTTSGTVSDLDGSFSIKALESQNLVISFVGYENVLLNADQGQ